MRSNLASSDEGGDGGEVEKLVTAIVSLACYAHLCLDMAVWKVHMAAIGRISEVKGVSLGPRLMALVEW